MQSEDKAPNTTPKPKKRRRISWDNSLIRTIKWDDSLEPTELLKKLRKDRLGVSQLIFDHLQYQLYVTNILKLKIKKDRQGKDRLYFYPAVIASTVGVIRDDAYIRIIQKLTAEEACKLLIFRFYNLSQPFPSNELVKLFNTSTTTKCENAVDETNKTTIETSKTCIKINDNFRLQNVYWTKQQRKACANTRDKFLNRGLGTNATKPFISDIPFAGNDGFFREVLIAFLKAKVTPDIICNICESCFFTENILDDDEELEKEKILEDDEELEKEIIKVFGQRKSITVITDEIKRENKAASTIQRAFRQHLETKIRAVRLIERWWEPFRLETEEIRLEIAQENNGHVQALEQQVNNEDLFKYDELVQEIKDDYNTIRRPEPRPPSYWIKVIAILVVPIFLSTLIKTMPEVGLLVVLYVLGHMMTLYRKIWYITWIQTLALWTWTALVLNNAFVLRNGSIRIPVWIAIVAFGRQRWMALFFVTVVIRLALTFVFDIFSIQPLEYGIFVYDAYCIATIAAASRQGKPIEMLQKVMINIVMLVIIASGGAVALVVACLHVEV